MSTPRIRFEKIIKNLRMPRSAQTPAGNVRTRTLIVLQILPEIFRRRRPFCHRLGLGENWRTRLQAGSLCYFQAGSLCSGGREWASPLIRESIRIQQKFHAGLNPARPRRTRAVAGTRRNQSPFAAQRRDRPYRKLTRSSADRSPSSYSQCLSSGRDP